MKTRSRLPAMPLISGKRMKVGLTVVSLLTVLWLVASLAFAYRLTRRMRPPFPEPLPAVEWGQFEPHRFRTTDGEEIGAWLVLGRPDAPTVLLIPGIGASRSACLSRGANALGLRVYGADHFLTGTRGLHG